MCVWQHRRGQMNTWQRVRDGTARWFWRTASANSLSQWPEIGVYARELGNRWKQAASAGNRVTNTMASCRRVVRGPDTGGKNRETGRNRRDKSQMLDSVQGENGKTGETKVKCLLLSASRERENRRSTLCHFPDFPTKWTNRYLAAWAETQFGELNWIQCWLCGVWCIDSCLLLQV